MSEPARPAKLVDTEATSVQTYLQILQGVITRVATNSANCKGWCITLTAGIAALGTDPERHDLLIVAIIPIAVFGVLDGYYFLLEKRYRNRHDDVVAKVTRGQLEVTELFRVAPIKRAGDIEHVLLSFAMIPAYAFMIAVLVFLRFCWF